MGDRDDELDEDDDESAYAPKGDGTCCWCGKPYEQHIPDMFELRLCPDEFEDWRDDE